MLIRVAIITLPRDYARAMYTSEWGCFVCEMQNVDELEIACKWYIYNNGEEAGDVQYGFPSFDSSDAILALPLACVSSAMGNWER